MHEGCSMWERAVSGCCHCRRTHRRRPLPRRRQAIDEEAAVAAVQAAFDAGINFFDTSPYYGDTRSEAVRGCRGGGRWVVGSSRGCRASSPAVERCISQPKTRPGWLAAHQRLCCPVASRRRCWGGVWLRCRATRLWWPPRWAATAPTPSTSGGVGAGGGAGVRGWGSGGRLGASWAAGRQQGSEYVWAAG